MQTDVETSTLSKQERKKQRKKERKKETIKQTKELCPLTVSNSCHVFLKINIVKMKITFYKFSYGNP